MTKNIRTFALKLSLVAGIATFGWLDAQPAQAGTATANLSIGATVSANCLISTTAIAFGSYDSLTNATAPLDNTGAVSVTCTSGAAATITLGQGANADTGSTDAAPLRRMSDGGANRLSYQLYSDSGRTTTWGNTAGTGSNHTGDGTAHSLTVYGRVASGQSVTPGTYSDTVVATVTF